MRKQGSKDGKEKISGSMEARETGDKVSLGSFLGSEAVGGIPPALWRSSADLVAGPKGLCTSTRPKSAATPRLVISNLLTFKVI